MSEEIKNNLNNPKQLEQLYRNNKTAFKKAFDHVYPDVQGQLSAQIWHERLHFERGEISWGAPNELAYVAILSFIAGLLAKIPDFFGLAPDYFFQRNISFVALLMPTAYFAWKQRVSTRNLAIIAALILGFAVYINLLPGVETDTLILACIHLPLLMWSILGYVFTGAAYKNDQKRIDFLRFNGDVVVMGAVILIAGAILSLVTTGLFGLINIDIKDFYFSYVAIWGLAAAPLVSAYLVQSNTQLVSNVSPVIAKVFTPLVLMMLIAYVGAIVYTGKDPYNDREFLIVFNMLLVGVMAIILFSTAGNAPNAENRISTALLFALSCLTIVVNGIALSAIVFRISEWGFTPNRLAVLGSNTLMLANLLIVSYRLYQSLRNPDASGRVESGIASFLPLYSAWAAVVVFVFPALFGFK